MEVIRVVESLLGRGINLTPRPRTINLLSGAKDVGQVENLSVGYVGVFPSERLLH